MGLSTAIKRDFFAGVVLIAPLVVTLIVLRVLVNWLLGSLRPIVRGTRLARYFGDVEIVAQLVTAVALLALVIVLGAIARRELGRQVFGGLGRLVGLVPLIGSVYESVRQVANGLADRGSQFQSVVLIEYPRTDVYMLGFVTNATPTAVDAATDAPGRTVYVPNTPNPSGGRLVFVPEDRVIELEMSVREAARLLITTGIGTGERTEPTPGDPAAWTGDF